MDLISSVLPSLQATKFDTAHLVL